MSKLISLIWLPLIALPVLAQQRQQFTSADYAHAEQFMGYNATPLVYKSAVRPTFLSAAANSTAGGAVNSAAATPNDERFYYRNTTAEGTEFILVDPVRGTRAPAFDHAKLAAALSTPGIAWTRSSTWLKVRNSLYTGMMTEIFMASATR